MGVIAIVVVSSCGRSAGSNSSFGSSSSSKNSDCYCCAGLLVLW